MNHRAEVFVLWDLPRLDPAQLRAVADDVRRALAALRAKGRPAARVHAAERPA